MRYPISVRYPCERAVHKDSQIISYRKPIRPWDSYCPISINISTKFCSGYFRNSHPNRCGFRSSCIGVEKMKTKEKKTKKTNNKPKKNEKKANNS